MTMRLALSLAVLVVLTAPVYADTVVYSTSFENPPFTTGPIAGQDGWAVFGPGISSVENGFAKTGSQAVFVDGGTAGQSGPYHSDSPAGPLVDLSADIAIFQSSTQTPWQFSALGPGLSQFLGGIDILANNQIDAQTTAGPGGLLPVGIFPRATVFDGTAWHHIDLLFNMPAQTYNLSLDGILLASNLPFCGSNSGCSGAPVAAYGTGLFDSFGTGNDAGYIDNFRVASVSGVPEPSSVALFMSTLGIIGLGLRRKSRV